MRVVIILLFSFMFTTSAWGQNRQRVAISDTVEDLDFKTRPDILGTCVIPGATSGANGCKIHKYLFCTNGQCVPRTTSGPSANPALFSTFHPWASAASTLEGTNFVDVIMLTGNDFQAKAAWVEANAVTERIAAFVLVHGTTANTLSTTQIDKFNNQLGVTVVNSSGNGGENGFSPNQIGVFGMNGLAARNDTIAVGAGFKIGPSPCDSLPREDTLGLQILCLSNAPNSANGPENFYVEFACAPGYSYETGKACGTSFSAPRVAGIIAEMRYVNPSMTFAQIKAALSQSTNATAKGAYIDQPNGIRIQYERVDLQGALLAVPVNTLEPHLEYSISNVESIFQIPNCDPNINGRWACYTLVTEPLTLTINDTSKVEGVLVDRQWSVYPDMAFQQSPSGDSISIEVGPANGKSYSSQKPEEVTLELTDSNNQTAELTVSIIYPNIEVGCAIHFDDTGTEISDVCTRILFAGDSGTVETLPSPMLVTQSFLLCNGNISQHYISAKSKGTTRLLEYQYRIGAGGWINLDTTRSMSTIADMPSNASITVRVRNLSTFGWSDYEYISFQSETCGGFGGFGGFGDEIGGF